MEDRPLADLFPPATRERWLGLVDGVLKGADFEKRLVSKTADGLRIEPLYEAAEPVAQPVRAPGPWRIAQRVDHPEAEAARALAMADLEGGADALTLVFAAAPAARGYGLDASALDAALDGVMLPLIAIRLDAGGGAPQAAAAFKALAARRNEPLSGLDLDLGLDPIGTFAATGSLGADFGGVLSRILSDFDADGFTGRACLADGRPYHAAGASEAAELAAVLATAVAYLRALEAGGHDLARARDAIAVLLVADADEFLTIAKFRALRRLWARVEDACGLAPEPIRLHAETAWRMVARRDPATNLLRATLACAGAMLGGADGVTVLPHTAALGLADPFARRLARNTALVLRDEAGIDRVADPAAGSGAVEALTEALCAAAWDLLGDLERRGGLPAALVDGSWSARLALTRATRRAELAAGTRAILGTTAYPLAEEPAPAVLKPLPAVPPRADGALPSRRDDELAATTVLGEPA